MSVLLTQTEDTVNLISLQIIQLADIGQVTKDAYQLSSRLCWSCLSKLIEVLETCQYLQRKTFMLELPTANYYKLEMFFFSITDAPSPTPTCGFTALSSSLNVAKLTCRPEKLSH